MSLLPLLHVPLQHRTIRSDACSDGSGVPGPSPETSGYLSMTGGLLPGGHPSAARVPGAGAQGRIQETGVCPQLGCWRRDLSRGLSTALSITLLGCVIAFCP